MSVYSMSKICLIAVGLVLIACNVVCIAWLLVSKAQPPTPPETSKCTNAAMPSTCLTMSSKAHCSLKVSKDENYTKEDGEVKWDYHSSPASGISLDENRTAIIVDSSGHYLVFVQATFKSENYTGTERLRVALSIDNEPSVVALDEREFKANAQKQVLRLCFMEPLELVKGQNIKVIARHRDKFDYNTPVSTILTMVKYSNLEESER